MKRLLLIILPLLLIVGCSKNQPINVNELILSGDKITYNSRENNQPYTGPIFFTDENNRVFIEGHLKNGIKVDTWKFWNDDGSIVEGLVEEYSSNYSGNYIEFQKDTTSIKTIITIVDGVKQGPSVWYSSNGDREERTIKDGVIQGPSVYYSSDGDRGEFTYKDGVRQGPSVYYSSDGDRGESTYKDGLIQGPSVYYFSDGDREERTYKDGVRQGPYIFYSSSKGKFKGHKEGGTYIDGKKEGMSIYYYPDGTTKSLFYKNGERLK